MKHISLFSGIGGFDLAAEWMGWDNIAHCEWNEFGQRILKYYWPKSISYGDITKTDFTKHRGGIDIVSGGFPCQPYSSAGKRKGKEDDRHLWPEMLRAIREIQPRWVVGENVRGLTNWNGGLVFDEVQADLEAEGFEVLPFLLPACAVNAPHRRDRIWFVAYRNNEKQSTQTSDGERPTCKQVGKGRKIRGIFNWNDEIRAITDTDIYTEGQYGKSIKNERKRVATSKSDRGGQSKTVFIERLSNISEFPSNSECIGQQGSGRPERQFRKKEDRNWQASWTYPNDRWPTQSPVCGRDDGLSSRLDGITLPKHRNESLKGYGNAVVPQLVYQIFKAIEEYEK